MDNSLTKHRLSRATLLRSALVSALSVATGSALTTALAQTDDTDASDGRRLETITVTAQFREQSLQDVPNAVTVFTAGTIADAGIESTSDFVALTPNVTFDDSFTYLNSFVVIRGVTQINNADSPVAIIVDGVPQNNQKQFKMPLFDIQQIEVLKGPQGSLYGRNAIGGAINIVTAQPGNKHEGFINGTAANGNAQRLQVGISGPIIEDQMLFRLSGTLYQRDGLIENTFLKEKVDFVDRDLALRGKIAWTPNDVFSLDLRTAYNEVKAGSSYDAVVNSPANPDFRQGNDANRLFAPTTSLAGITEGDITEWSGKAEWDLGGAVATYIFGYTDINEQYRADLDFSNPGQATFPTPPGQLGQGQNLAVKLTSHELRFVSPDEQAFRWLGGFYHLDTRRDLLTRAFLDADGKLSQFDTGTFLLTRIEDNKNTAWAVFGQVEFDVTDRMELQLGARYDEDKRNQTNPGTAGSERSRTFDSFQPKITLSYDFIGGILGYATYSTGFRSGGFNAPGVVLEEFGDETLTNYEIGFKSRFANGRGTLNGALFTSQSDDFQFFFIDVTTASQIISNLEKVDLTGFDIDFQYRINDQVTIHGGVGYIDSKIKRIGNTALQNFLTNANVDIKRAIGANSPKTTDWTLVFGGQVKRPLNNGLEVVLRADYEYQGKKYWQIDNLDVRDPLNLLSLRAGIEGENWHIALWGRNLLDEGYYSDFNPAEYVGAPFDIGFQAQPATYGITLGYRY